MHFPAVARETLSTAAEAATARAPTGGQWSLEEWESWVDTWATPDVLQHIKGLADDRAAFPFTFHLMGG